MNTLHIFLTAPTVPVSDRWCEAFPTGLMLNYAALKARLQSQADTACLIWLNSTDSQWAQHLRDILQIQPGALLILLSSAPDSTEGLSALNEGVHGYTHAYGVPALLQEVAMVVEHGGLWVGPDLLQRLVGSTNATLARRTVPGVADASMSNAWLTLSAREAQVARAVLTGRSNKEVATLMFISERTVKAHLGVVFEKLGVRDRLQLVLRLAASADPEPASTKEAAV